MRCSLINVLFVALVTQSSAQIEEGEFNMGCEEATISGYDTLVVNTDTVRFKLITRSQLCKIPDTIESDIVLPAFDSGTNHELVKMVLKKIASRYNVHRFNAFTNCHARDIYYQALKPSKEGDEYVKSFFIGSFEIR